MRRTVTNVGKVDVQIAGQVWGEIRKGPLRYGWTILSPGESVTVDRVPDVLPAGLAVDAALDPPKRRGGG